MVTVRAERVAAFGGALHQRALGRRDGTDCASSLWMLAIGKRRWAIAEGYIPAGSHGAAPEMTSHEAACLLNSSDSDAHVTITIFFTDREPVGPYRLTVPARRSKHLRFNALTDPERIPLGTEYSSLIESNVPIVVQHTRLDSRQSENALMTSLAFGQD